MEESQTNINKSEFNIMQQYINSLFHNQELEVMQLLRESSEFKVTYKRLGTSSLLFSVIFLKEASSNSVMQDVVFHITINEKFPEIGPKVNCQTTVSNI